MTPKDAIQRSVDAHEQCDREEIERLRGLTMEERTRLLQAACAAAAVLRQSRIAAGLGDVEPVPWPASTWEFQRKHAARFGSPVAS